MYATGAATNGSSTSEMGPGPVTVASDGSFSIPATYSCPSTSAQVFVVVRATSGNLPSTAKADGLATMATLGTCADLASANPITVNAQTTAASVLSLAPYMSSANQIDASSESTAALAAAFLSARAPATAQGEPVQRLAAQLASCSASPTTDAAASLSCRQFFNDAATTSGEQPTDTIEAALTLVAKPGLSVNIAPTANSAAGLSAHSASVMKASSLQSTLAAPFSSASAVPVASLTPINTLLPQGHTFTPPDPNACNSPYDRYYMAEPGVYAFWALCEAGNNPSIHDYVGLFDLTWASGAWSSPNGTIYGGVAGPLADGETADKVTTASSYVAGMKMPLNSRQGTVAIWANTEATNYPMSMMWFGAVNGSSAINLAALTPATGGQCFVGSFANTGGTSFTTTQACGFQPNTWHRVVFTWQTGAMTVYVDGVSRGTGTYTGTLDNKVFVYRLFPQSGNTGKQMTLAKALVSNQVWTTAQVKSDFKPTLITAPATGIYVTSNKLGTIHQDVLGYADINSDISTKDKTDALTSGLMKSGIHSIRYANGSTGITADLEDWRGGNSCSSKPGVTTPPGNQATNNILTQFVPKVSSVVGASLGYTVNYGTNPPFCNAGGDPIINGANLVDFANNQHHYGVKYWEIGNELYNGGGSETDFHPTPGNGLSYSSYESKFFDSMKSKDSTIKIGIPVGDGVYSWLADWTLPAMANAKYDAVVYHSYPVQDAVTDGDTLYGDRVASSMSRVRGGLLALQTELLNVGKSPEAIWVTEWNADAQSNGTNAWSRQTLGAAMPMFAAMQLAEYMQAGVQYASWFGQGTPNGCWPWNYDWAGQTTYSWNSNCGGPFLTYTGAIQGEVEVGLKAGDITPVARAFQLLSESKFVSEGEHMVQVVTDANSPWLAGYAATHGTSYAVLLINRDRDASHSVPVNFADQSSGSTVTQWTYGRAQYDLTRSGNWSADPTIVTSGAWAKSKLITLPPWSVSVLVFKR